MTAYDLPNDSFRVTSQLWDEDLKYLEVADDIAARIKDGRLFSGQRIPGERELAVLYDCAYTTIRRATKELRRRDLIRTIHGRGTFIK